MNFLKYLFSFKFIKESIIFLLKLCAFFILCTYLGAYISFIVKPGSDPSIVWHNFILIHKLIIGLMYSLIGWLQISFVGFLSFLAFNDTFNDIMNSLDMPLAFLIYCKDIFLSFISHLKDNILAPAFEHFFVLNRDGGFSSGMSWFPYYNPLMIEEDWFTYYSSVLNSYDVQSGSLLYLLGLMLFFPLGIFLNYKGKVTISKIKEDKDNSVTIIRLNITKFLCNLWLFFNFFFIIFYVFQFDFIATTRLFFLPSMNLFDLLLCLLKIFLLVCYCIFLVIFKEIIMNSFQKDDESSRYLSFEYLILTGFFILGSLILLGSETFVEVFLSLEVQSYSLYILAGSDRKRILSSESGLKYFIFGSFSSLIGLLGIAILYYETGFFDLSDVLLYISGDLSPNLCGLGLILFFFNLFFKLGIFPFHFWMPDVFHGSPLLYTIFFSFISKIGPFGFYVYFCFYFLSSMLGFSYLLFFVSVASIILGSISAFGQ